MHIPWEYLQGLSRNPGLLFKTIFSFQNIFAIVCYYGWQE